MGLRFGEIVDLQWRHIDFDNGFATLEKTKNGDTRFVPLPDQVAAHLKGMEGPKLLARHHETLEALLKYRRKGEQRVHVEHVHIHDGGQAIVGNVIPGGGMNQKLEEGPHAKV